MGSASQSAAKEISLWGGWKVFLEPPIPAPELRQMLQENAAPSWGFYFLLGLSAAIGSLGLIANSVAVIIGAMIIAPLMNPIVAISYSISRGLGGLAWRAGLTLITGIIWVLLISYAISELIGSRLAGSEILSRSNPNLIDLGVAIASGAAGAFAWTRKKIANAIPGVAIAVALVPPLCVVGIGLSTGASTIADPDFARMDDISSIEIGSFLLFFTNLAAICFCGALVFLSQGYGTWRRALKGIIVASALLVLVAYPLGVSSSEVIARSRVLEEISLLVKENPEWSRARLRGISIEIEKKKIDILIEVDAPEGLITTEDLKIIQSHFEKKAARPIRIRIHLSEYRTLQSDS